MGFDPFLVELEAGGRREEVAVLRGIYLAPVGGLDLAPMLVAGFFFFFLFSGFLVDCGCGLVGFDLDRLGFSGSLVGFDDLAADWVMIWLDWVSVNHCCGRSVNHCCCDCCCGRSVNQ